MPIDERWNALTVADWDAFAAAWLAESRGEAVPDSDIGLSVVMMNFSSTAEHQWQFILAAMSHAESDDDLGHISAGPVEHLLGNHGTEYIERFEEMAATNPKFGRMMLGVWKYMMPDEVWDRVQAIQAVNHSDGHPDTT